MIREVVLAISVGARPLAEPPSERLSLTYSDIARLSSSLHNTGCRNVTLT